MTPDPIMQAPFWNQGLNRYSYVFNDPVNNTDPSGWSSVGDRFSTAWNKVGGALSSAFVDTKNDEGLGIAVMGWGAAAVGGGASGASGTLGVGSISATVNNPRLGGGFGGSSATASLYSSSAMSRGLEQRLAKAPDHRLAYGPESLLDPNSAFPDTEWGRAARDTYLESYFVVGASLLSLGLAQEAAALLGARLATLRMADLLVRSEMAGGHLIARHVGMTTSQLAARLAGTQLPAASTFGTFWEAVAGVGTALEANAARIAAWQAAGATGRLVIGAAFSGGAVLVRGATSPTVGNGVRFVLEGIGGGAWRVLTGFPIP